MQTAQAENEAFEKLQDTIQDKSYPCVGAKSAVARGKLTHIELEDMRSSAVDERLLEAFSAFVEAYRDDRAMFTSFAVSWKAPRQLTEVEFEKLLWQRLQALHELDSPENPWDPRVENNPRSPHFAFSLCREAFFVIGLHKGASRIARRTEHPTLVFNLHDQFERLREEGLYANMRETILKRDRKLQGSVNPMLAEHGNGPAASQYSGRVVGENWRCPFEPRSGEGSASVSA